MNPKDTPAPLAVAVNFETGHPLTDRQKAHLQAIREAGDALYEAMHNAEGSTMPGQGAEHVFQSRRMIRAAEHLELVLMLARKAALE